MDEVSDVPEVIFASAESGQHNCIVYDIKSFNQIAVYKAGHSSYHGFTLVGEDYVMSALCGQPLLRWWTISNKEGKKEGKIVCPGIVQALAVSSCGSFCVAAVEKTIYIWEVKTGELLSCLACHYDDITCLRFSSDGSYFVSCGRDGLVNVWFLPSTISIHSDNDVKSKPYFQWTHAEEVTDVFIGAMGVYSCIASVSHDMTCKIHELGSRTLLSTICMDHPLSCVAMDPTESILVLGTVIGSIHRINYAELSPGTVHYADMPDKYVFKGHSSEITCLSISSVGTILLSGSRDDTIKVWNLQDLGIIKTIKLAGPVTNAFIADKPPALYSDEPVKPAFKIADFQRAYADYSSGINFALCTRAPQTISLFHYESPDGVLPKRVLNIYDDNVWEDVPSLREEIEILEKANQKLYLEAHIAAGEANFEAMK